jgi:hypothetical protein
VPAAAIRFTGRRDDGGYAGVKQIAAVPGRPFRGFCHPREPCPNANYHSFPELGNLKP